MGNSRLANDAERQTFNQNRKTGLRKTEDGSKQYRNRAHPWWVDCKTIPRISEWYAIPLDADQQGVMKPTTPSHDSRSWRYNRVEIKNKIKKNATINLALVLTSWAPRYIFSHGRLPTKTCEWEHINHQKGIQISLVHNMRLALWLAVKEQMETNCKAANEVCVTILG